MKKIVATALVLMFFATLGSARAEPLAPLAELDGRFGKMLSPAEREVPDLSKVGIPAYPGSLFCTIKTGDWGETGWSEAHLISTDPYEMVSAWYRKKMDGWYCNEWSKDISFSCSDKDPGAAGNYDSETFNVVDVLKNSVSIPCALPGMQTGIAIRFQPD